MPQTVLHPLAPLITAESHTLILGDHAQSPQPRGRLFTTPTRRTAFWPVIAALYGEEDPKTSEGPRRAAALPTVWPCGMLASCTITGAADSTIRDPIPMISPACCAGIRASPASPPPAAPPHGFTAAWWSPKLVCPPSGCPAPPLPMPAPHSRSWWPPIAPPLLLPQGGRDCSPCPLHDPRAGYCPRPGLFFILRGFARPVLLPVFPPNWAVLSLSFSGFAAPALSPPRAPLNAQKPPPQGFPCGGLFSFGLLFGLLGVIHSAGLPHHIHLDRPDNPSPPRSSWRYHGPQ